MKSAFFLSAPEISLPLVESVENEIFAITQEFVQQRFLGISFHAPMTNQYLSIPKFDTAGRERGLKILPLRKSANAAFAARWKKSVSGSEVSRIECSVQGEVIGAYEMRQLQGWEWTQYEIDKPSVNVSINFKVNRSVRKQYRRKKKS